MRMLTVMAAAIFATACPLSPATAGVNEDVRLCRAALEAHADVDASKYRARFERIKGGRIRVVRFALVPRVEDATPLKVYCTIKKGVVTDLELR